MDWSPRAARGSPRGIRGLFDQHWNYTRSEDSAKVVHQETLQSGDGNYIQFKVNGFTQSSNNLEFL